jgi:hypothetical protein
VDHPARGCVAGAGGGQTSCCIFYHIVHDCSAVFDHTVHAWVVQMMVDEEEEEQESAPSAGTYAPQCCALTLMHTHAHSCTLSAVMYTKYSTAEIRIALYPARAARPRLALNHDRPRQLTGACNPESPVPCLWSRLRFAANSDPRPNVQYIYCVRMVILYVCTGVLRSAPRADRRAARGAVPPPLPPPEGSTVRSTLRRLCIAPPARMYSTYTGVVW